ncbi:unnamed protein product [Clonostachys rosea]|uniref:GH16 domain-containing protein n=1 Tax=Bionectria ochroleuca TaxID=29856 RepID=A0ABY6TXQ3_BIOOC|nr:unnamed protein product [Clonostachys rosea]
MLSKTLFTALALVASASAQTYTDCNPTKESCSPAPALGNKKISCDYTKGDCADFTKLAGTSYSLTADKGAKFSIDTLGQAPTIASNKWIFFGRIDVVCQAAPGVGVITSVVLQSADLDEIDLEWVGGDDYHVQTNYFGKGDTTTYDRGGIHNVNSPVKTFHKYSVEWTAKKIDWLVDDVVIRTLNYADAQGGARFPQTPSQIKIGTWVAGYEGNNQGTIDWAGGIADFKKAPFDAYYKSVTVTDYAGGDSAPSESIKEYQYTDKSGAYKSIKVVKGESDSSSSSTSVSKTSAASTSASKTSSAASSSAASTTAASSSSAVSSAASSSSVTKASSSGSGSASSTKGGNSSSAGQTTASASTTPGSTTPQSSVPTTPGSTPVGSATESSTVGSATKSSTAGSATESAQLTTSTVYSTVVHTVTSCAATVTNCPAKSTVLVTETVPVYTTVCPVTELPTKSDSGNGPKPTDSNGSKPTDSAGNKPTGTGSGNVPASSNVPTSTPAPNCGPGSPNCHVPGVTIPWPPASPSAPATATATGSPSGAVSSNSPNQPIYPTGTFITTTAAPSHPANGTSISSPAIPTTSIPTAGAARFVGGAGVAAGFAALAAMLL